MPNQYEQVKHAVKGEEDIQDNTGHTHTFGFIDEYLEEAINTSNMYESTQETDYDYWISEHSVHANCFCYYCP